MILLLHPTHRKFIRLLRNHTNNGEVIILTQEDKDEWLSFLSRTKNSKKRHQITYRIFLRAINRKRIESTEDVIVINHSSVDYIERVLRKVEFKNPFRTIKNIILMKVARVGFKVIKYFE